MINLLVGFMTCAWLLTVGGVAYSIWRYVYCPWKVVRLDIQQIKANMAALTQKIEDGVQAINTRQFEAMTDTELAAVEQRLRSRSLGRVGTR